MDQSKSLYTQDDARLRRFRSLSISLPPEDGRYITIDEVLPAVYGQPPQHMQNTHARHHQEPDALKTAHYWQSQVAQWKTEAIAGNAVAAQNVGVALLKGESGVPKNEVEAVKYFKMAAKAGLNVSMFNLGWAYASGAGVAQSWEQAVKWWRRAAKAGHSSAARNLGLLYMLGIAPGEDGEPRVSYSEAARWYRLSAEMGNHKACFALAQCYDSGQGVVKSDADAAYWRKRGEELQEKAGQSGAQPEHGGYTAQ